MPFIGGKTSSAPLYFHLLGESGFACAGKSAYHVQRSNLAVLLGRDFGSLRIHVNTMTNLFMIAKSA